MAANVPVTVTTATEEGPLSSFDRVSKIVYLYRPSSSSTSSSSADKSAPPAPRLIVVGGWMDAREPHLAKYTTRLQAMYPASPILLIRSFAYHFTGSRLAGEVEPAVPLIRSLVAAADGGGGGGGGGDGGGDPRPGEPQMLVHVFSNGGSAVLRVLYDAYARAAGSSADDDDDDDDPAAGALPAHVTVFDSAPGRFSWAASARAFGPGPSSSSSSSSSSSLFGAARRLLWRAAVHCLCAAYWVVLRVARRGGGFLEATGAAHNDRAANRAEARRAYVYGAGDRLVAARDVEAHAAAARARGFAARLERFVGTAHVAHARGDGERYWRVVAEAWEGRGFE